MRNARIATCPSKISQNDHEKEQIQNRLVDQICLMYQHQVETREYHHLGIDYCKYRVRLRESSDTGQSSKEKLLKKNPCPMVPGRIRRMNIVAKDHYPNFQPQPRTQLGSIQNIWKFLLMYQESDLQKIG